MSPTSASGRTSGHHSPISGAAPTHEYEDPVLRAISRRQTGRSSFDPLTRKHSVKFAFTSPDYSPSPDDTLLEPLPFERVSTSLSEVFMTHTATFESGIDLSRFGGHRDTFAILGLRRKQSRDLSLPTSFFERLLRYIDFETYLAIRVSCRSWSETVSQVYPPRLPSVYHLPAEILEQIYYHLPPVDFNAARHTCRAWMLASLNTRLLTHMLARGGWSNAARADEVTLEQWPLLAITNEWPLSKRLATECQLRQEWSGNGLAYSTDIRPLAVTTEIDFSELLSSFEGPSGGNAAPRYHSLPFTPSTCGRYLLVTVDTTVVVYKLYNKRSTHSHRLSHGLDPVTSIPCPRRILAVSMDTSQGRFAVAALLEGRIGLVCEFSATSDRPLSTYHHSSATHFEIVGKDVIVDETLPSESLAYHNRYGDMTPWDKEEMLFTSSPEQYSVCPTPNGIPVEQGPRSIFRNLCSEEHPPRSVAICPQRRCVAFGCSAGIELHWTDILSGQDMNRWFPLANSSDYLTFIPPRPEGDSIKRLRLASSAANYAPDMGVPERQEDEMDWESTGNLAFQNGSRTPSPASTKEHLHTVPLSDGIHALFTDASSGHVCLGRLSDSGASDSGIAKRVILHGPRGQDGSDTRSIPKCYAAAQELSWGVRIAVGYADDSLYLFSIPIDILHASDGKDWQLNWIEEYGNSGQQTNASDDSGLGTGWLDWPIHLPGMHIADLERLEDLAVDASHGGVTLWLFSSDGMVREWEMSNGEGKEVWKGLVGQDGMITNAMDVDGDWNMKNAPWSPSWASTPAGYDGEGTALRSHPTMPILSSHPAWSLDNRANIQRPSSEDEGYASDEGEPSHSIDVDSTASLSARFGRLRLSDSDVEMLDVDCDDEGYFSAESRAGSPTGFDGAASGDEGYESASEGRSPTPTLLRSHKATGNEDDKLLQWASSPLAICIPSPNKEWNGESFEGHDWTPDHLRMKEGWAEEGDGNGREDEEDLDLWDLREVEVLIL